MSDKDLQTVGEQVIKQKRSKKSEQMSVHLEPGDNVKYLGNALAIYNLPEIDTSDIEQVQKRIEEYFNICIENEVKPSVEGMALALGVDRRTVYQWSVGETRKETHTPTIKKAYRLLNVLMADYMQNGKINPVSGIFLMKNNFGYADKQEVVLSPNNPLGEQKDTEEIRQKYIESTVVDD